MKLVYLWMYEYGGGLFDKTGFCFSNRIMVTVDYKDSKESDVSSFYGKKKAEEVTVSVKLELKEGTDAPPFYYGERILGMTSVVGKNGAGKTSLLRAIMQSDNMQTDLTGESTTLCGKGDSIGNTFLYKETARAFFTVCEESSRTI